MAKNDRPEMEEYARVRKIVNRISVAFFIFYITIFVAVYFRMSGLNPEQDYTFLLYGPGICTIICTVICCAVLLHFRCKAQKKIKRNGNIDSNSQKTAQPSAGI